MTATLEQLLDRVGSGSAAVRDPCTTLEGGALRAAVAGLAATIARRTAPGDLVALMLDRSVAHAVAVLACLWAGRGFLSVQRTDPAGAQRDAVRQTDARLVLAAPGDVAADGLSATIVDLHEAGEGAPAAAPAGQLAYCIRTSGSTGEPKTIAVSRGALAHYLHHMIGYLDADTLDGAVLQLNPAFDAALTPLLLPLVTGRSLELIAPGEEITGLAAALAHRRGRWLVDVTPGQIAPLADELTGGPQTQVRGPLLIGGEPLSPVQATLARAALPGMTIHNIYGPAETTVGSSVGPVAVAPADVGISVGRAIGETLLYVLAPDGDPVAPGATGEIAVGGPGVALGYRAAARSTAARFVPDPRGAPGARMYLTGDRGRMDADGRLHCDGRLDDQVKVRGFRVELGAVEVLVTALPGVVAAAVARDEQTGELVAFVRGVPDSDLPTLRDTLAVGAPAGAAPAFWKVVDRFPLTANGKLDRSRLLAAWRAGRASNPKDVARPDASGGEDAPVGDQLTEIWRDLLGHSRFGCDDAFFTVGGHSLLAVRLRAAIRRRLGRVLPMAALIEASTLRRMAQLIEAGDADPAAPLPLAASTGPDAPLSPFQEPLWLSSRRAADRGATDPYLVISAMRITGPIDPDRLRDAIATVLDRHGVFATRFVAGVTVAQRVGDRALVAWTMERFAGEADARARLDSFAAEPLDPASPPLVRVGLFGFADDGHLLAFQAHHLVTDQWTMALIASELTQQCAGEPLPPPPPREAFAAISRRQRTAFDAEQWEHHARDWEAVLAGISPPAPLLRRAATPSGGRVERLSAAVTGEVLAGLVAAARRAAGTMNAAALAVFAAAARRHAGLAELVVYAPVTVRDGDDEAGVAGYFLNNVVLRVPLADDDAASQMATATGVVKRALAHRLAPFDEVRGRCRALSELDRFHARFAFVTADPLLALPGCVVEDLPLPLRAAKFHLQVTAEQTEDALVFHFDFDPERHARAEVAALADAITRAAAALADAPLASTDPRAALRARLSARLRDASPSIPVPTPHVEPWPEMAGIGRFSAPVPDAPLADAIARHRAQLRDALLRHGAILCRGWSLPDLETFGATVAGLGDGLIEYENRSTPRTRVTGRVFTSTEYPAHQSIPLHNENSYTHRWPGLIGFYCRRTAAQGGATPICDSRTVFNAIPAVIRETFERRQVRYTRHFGRAGLSWQETFQTEDRTAVDAYCSANAISATWDDAGSLSTSQVLPATRRHPVTGDPVWFNQAHLFHVSSLGESAAEDMVALFGLDRLPRHATFGDGEEIPAAALAEIRAAYAGAARAFAWQDGDVLLLDNMLFAHGRDPFAGPREVFVGMARFHD